MVYRGRGNPRARGFIRPFRARGRGRRPFPYRGQNRGSYGRGREDEGLRITLRNTGRDRHDEGEYDRHEHEPGRRDSYEEQRSNEFEQGTLYDDDHRESPRRESSSGRATPPRKRPHIESDHAEDESLKITVNSSYEDRFSDRKQSPHSSHWEHEDRKRNDSWSDERRDEHVSDDRGSNEERRYSRDDDHRDSNRPPDRGRGYKRGYDPNYRGRGNRARGDFRGGFRGRGWGTYENFERGGRGRGYHRGFERGRGSYHSRDRYSFDGDFDRGSHRRRSLSRDRRRSRSRDRYSRSPGRRRSRSRSYGRGRSYSLERRSADRRSSSRGRRSYSRDRRSYSRDRRRSYSRDRRSDSGRRRSSSSSRSYDRSRHSSSRSFSDKRSPGRSFSRSRSGSPIRREQITPINIAAEAAGDVSHVAENSASPPRSRSVRRSLSRGRDRHSPGHSGGKRRQSSSSSSSSTSDSRSRDSHPELSEQQYEEEMYRRLKSEIVSNKDPREREESIAKHIREMAKLSPVLFRQFMSKNAGNLSTMALLQPDVPEPGSAEGADLEEADDPHNSRPLRSILKRKPDSRSPSLDRNPSPPPEPQPKSLTQIEKVIQALRKGGVKQEEQKPEQPEEAAPPPTGALRQLSSYMDIEEEEEFLYGDNTKAETVAPEHAAPLGPFWSANRFNEKQQADDLDHYTAAEQSKPPATSKPPSLDIFENLPSTSQSAEHVKVPSAFSTFEEKEKSYEKWRASVFRKQTPEKPKEAAPPQSSTETGGESAEQLSSTVENILKSIGFNFELSQRMQELARQKKEGEQEAIKINQSASFLGADSDDLAQNLTNVFQKEEEPPKPQITHFMKEVEAATRAARGKAQRAKEAEERRAHGPTPSQLGSDRDTQRERDKFSSRHATGADLPGRSRKDSDRAGGLPRLSVPSTTDHSPYDPSVQDYRQESFQSQQQYSHEDHGMRDFELYQESSDLFENSQQSRPIRASNLIALGGGSRGQDSKSLRHEDHSRHEKNAEEASYKKSGERILIVKKKEETGRTDSPDSIFSRRIVLPPKEKNKPIQVQVRVPESDSRKDSKRRAVSPDSPRQFKVSRKSPSTEEQQPERIVYQKSKSTKQAELKKPQSPQRVAYNESKYKYQAPEGGSKTTDPKTKPEFVKAASSSKADYLKAKMRSELPKSGSKVESSVVKNAMKVAEDKAQLLERKRKLVTLENELEALRQQHNELLRKRRRQKDGHKDPLIVENTKLQDEISAQIKALRDGNDVPIFGGSSADKSLSVAAESSSSSKKISSKTNSVAKETPKVQYEYFDPGSHWCSSCNIVCGHMFDFFKHVESKKHQQKLDPFNRPWLLEAMKKQEKRPKPEGPVQAHPIKGLEFMMATSAFYCSICSEFCGDLSIAESHMKSEEHHDKYRDYLSQHPYYEKRHMLERSAALSMQKQSSPIEEQNDSNDSDADGSRKKDATKSKSIEKNTSKGKDDDWREKIDKQKTLYSDYEDEYRMKSASKEKDKRRHRERSADRSSRGRREGRDGSRERRNSRDRKDSKDSKGKDSDSSSSKSSKRETTSKDTNVSDKEAEVADAQNSESDQQAVVSNTTEETKKEEKADSDASKDETRKEGEAKKESEAEAKGKIPIKLTGKSGIKPASATPPWKVFTRPIPKGTMQKRLLAQVAARSQPVPAPLATGRGPAMPNEEPVPLGDFLTVGAKKSVPVMPDVTKNPYPCDPKALKQGDIVEEAESKERLEEMKMLGIDPVSLVPNVKPKPPPPPSQNLSLPSSTHSAAAVGKTSGNNQSSKRDGGKNTGTGMTGQSIQSAHVEERVAMISVPHHLPPPIIGTGMGMPAVPLSVPPPLPYMGLLPVPDTSVPPPGYVVPLLDTSVPPPVFIPPLPPPLPFEPPAQPPAPPEIPLPPPSPPPPAPLPQEDQLTAQEPVLPTPGASSSAGEAQSVSIPVLSEASQVSYSPPSSRPAEPEAVQAGDPVSGSAANSEAPENQAEATASATPVPQSDMGVLDLEADDEAQSGSAVEGTAQTTPSGTADDVQTGTKAVASSPGDSSASSVPEPASADVAESPKFSIVTEPQPSTSAPEVTVSGEALEPSSTQASPSPSKKTSTARRGRAVRRTMPVVPRPAEESTDSEIGVAADATSKRPRTRSQAKPQPLRQTRSRTRQKKTEGEEDSVTASDEGGLVKSGGEVGSSTTPEAESADGSKASSTSACVLDLTNPPADSSGGSETNTEVTSSSSDLKSSALTTSPPADSALNLTVPPELRDSRQGRAEQTMPEDLSSYAQPQDLSTSSEGRSRGRRPPEMPIDLTMRLVPSQSVDSNMLEEAPQAIEMQSSPDSQISSSEGVARGESLDPQTTKDTLLSSTSALNPSTSSLAELVVGDEGGAMEDTPSLVVDSDELGVDREGELVDFSLAPVDFEELEGMEMEDSGAAVPDAADAANAEESGGTADSTFPSN